MAQIIPGLIIGVVAAVASALVSHHLIQKREQERWKREDRVRFQADRLRLYRECMVMMRRHLQTGMLEFDAELMSPLVEEIQLVSSDEVAEAADALLSKAAYARTTAQRYGKGGQDVDYKDLAEKSEKAALELEAAYDRFVAAAREELGISKDRLDPQ